MDRAVQGSVSDHPSRIRCQSEREISDLTDPIRRIPSDPRQDKSKNMYYKNIAGLIVRVHIFRI